MPTIYLALGANLGDRMQNLRAALRQLAPHIKLTRLSPVYETEPWGIADQPRFLNMAVAAETTLPPHALLHALKHIEQNMGRTETIRYGPRVIDLDILLYDARVVQTNDLEIPHPRLAERRFVLVPLNDIAPTLVHPCLKKAVQELLRALPDDDTVHLFPESIALTAVQSSN
ncbi:MAG: 2-amino-4-hydroxy-6-hydroxymethyldihydropteridine diphosphokinase [Chloroflexi bacterium]|nr:2-amino-4-hydroxy-6-hydroxymethyldihydropteridine diphosphokinase [Chloroflexota bacterium]